MSREGTVLPSTGIYQEQDGATHVQCDRKQRCRFCNFSSHRSVAFMRHCKHHMDDSLGTHPEAWMKTKSGRSTHLTCGQLMQRRGGTRARCVAACSRTTLTCRATRKLIWVKDLIKAKRAPNVHMKVSSCCMPE